MNDKLRYLKYFGSLFSKGSPFCLTKDIIKDFFGAKNKVCDNEVHIKSAINWILEAQRSNNDGGVSEMYSLYEGWHNSYPETTGYIIPTMFNYYRKTKDIAVKKSALWMAEWELTKQMPSGAFPGGAAGGREFPIVFNTGQIIFGMVRAFQETNEDKFKKAAAKAADWLVKIQNKNGCWDKHTYLDKVHTYNTRTACSLLRVFKITGDKKYRNAATKNINWALAQQLDNGWFKYNAFHENREPLLHTIAYSIRGILEAGIHLNNEKYINAAEKPSQILLKKIRKDGSLPGSFDSNWNSSVKWSCLTGNSQTSIIFLRLYNASKNKDYLDAAKKLNHFVKSTQNLHSGNIGVKGGIKGAYPIYGWYAPFCYINWAVKFFVDSLMLEDDLSLGDELG